MNDTFRAVRITDRVYWVGAIDWEVRDFHGYLTSRGTTYNAYLILGEKNILIDLVKSPFKDEMISRIGSVVAPEKISYIISNHAEMDHTGTLNQMARIIQPEKLFASKIGAKTIAEHFHPGPEITTVDDGQSLQLGDTTLTFFETRMLHWPDSMITYFPDEKICFSQDIFGMHLASNERYADEIPGETIEHEAGKYYANIVLPYSGIVEKFLAKLEGLNLPLDIIAPDHGPIWRKDPMRIIQLYAGWAAQKASKKALLVYDTMWQSTALMAGVIADGLSAGGAAVKQMPLSSFHRSDVATEILDAGALIVGSPTLNNQMFPTIADVLCYLRGLKPRNLIGAAFGSFGWSGEGVKQVNDILAGMGLSHVAEPLKVRWVPDKETLARCHTYGRDLAKKILEASE
jgi:flavorubredoxin